MTADKKVVPNIKAKPIPINRKNRYSVLHHVIHNGCEVGSGEGAMIEGWTPNNVRRIILTTDAVIVQFHLEKLTRGSNKHIVKLENYLGALNSDVEVYKQKGKTGVKGVLDLLNDSTRKMSMLEEIIVCTKNYSQDVLEQDLKGFYAITNIKNKLVRFNYLTQINTDLNGIITVLKEFDYFKEGLMTETLLERKLPLRVLHKEDNPDWWKSTYIRDSKYTQDAELTKYFEEFKEKRSSIESKKIKPESVQEYAKVLTKLQYGINTIKQFRKLFNDNEELYSKGWGFWTRAVNNNENEKVLKEYVKTQKELYKKVKGMNTEMLVNVITNPVLPNDLRQTAMDLTEIMYLGLDKEELKETSVTFEETIPVIHELIELYFKWYRLSPHMGLLGHFIWMRGNYISRWMHLGAHKPYGVKITPEVVDMYTFFYLQVSKETEYFLRFNVKSMLERLEDIAKFSLVAKLSVEQEVAQGLDLIEALKGNEKIDAMGGIDGYDLDVAYMKKHNIEVGSYDKL